LTMRHMATGSFDFARWQEEYVKFMTTPNSHNDTYANSYHRIFFANRAAGKPLDQCPSGAFHDVDQIDGLIIPTVTLLANLPTKKEPEARAIAKKSVGVTRISKQCENYLNFLSPMLAEVLTGRSLRDSAQRVAKQLYGREINIRGADPVVSCYLDQAFPSVLHFAAKYDDKFEECMLANANCGGENVHRGMVLGALVGAAVGEDAIPEELKKGLFFYDEIKKEIDAFISKNISDDSIAGAPQEKM